MNRDQVLKLAEEAGFYREVQCIYAPSSHHDLMSRLQKFAELVEQSGSGEAVVTILARDPFDERPGYWMSIADHEKLSNLSVGTKLYTKPQLPSIERLVEIIETVFSQAALHEPTSTTYRIIAETIFAELKGE